MNVTLQMEAVNTIVLTPLGASIAAVTQDTSWMKMDQIAMVSAQWLTIIPHKDIATFVIQRNFETISSVQQTDKCKALN